MTRRPTSLERRRRQARIIAVVVAAAMVAVFLLPALAGVASAATPSSAGSASQPASGSASQPVVTTAHDAADTVDDEAVPAEVRDALGPGTGTPHTVWLWSTDFLRGESGVPAVVHADQWVAPAAVEGRSVGTRTAWRDPDQDGAVVPAVRDDDVELARALDSLGDEVVVFDAGSWLVLSGAVDPASAPGPDVQVRSLLPEDPAGTVEPMPLAEYQQVRAATYAEDLELARDGRTDLAGGSTTGEPGNGEPVTDGAVTDGGAAGGPAADSVDGPPRWLLPTTGAVALGVLVTVVLLRRRRTDP